MPAMTKSTAARAPTPTVKRDAKGRWLPGVSGNPGGDAARPSGPQRRHYSGNARAFRQGGREAIDKVMRTQPAAFLKLLVLLVPREMKVEQTAASRAMTDEQLGARDRGDPSGCWRPVRWRRRQGDRRRAGARGAPGSIA